MPNQSALKPGVVVAGLSPEILLAVMIAKDIVHGFAHPFTITSLLDGKHSKKSLHYKGHAVDIRTRMMNAATKAEFKRLLTNALGANYDVVLEATHMHIEFDPD